MSRERRDEDGEMEMERWRKTREERSGQDTDITAGKVSYSTVIRVGELSKYEEEENRMRTWDEDKRTDEETKTNRGILTETESSLRIQYQIRIQKSNTHRIMSLKSNPYENQLGLNLPDECSFSFLSSFLFRYANGSTKPRSMDDRIHVQIGAARLAQSRS